MSFRRVQVGSVLKLTRHGRDCLDSYPIHPCLSAADYLVLLCFSSFTPMFAATAHFVFKTSIGPHCKIVGEHDNDATSEHDTPYFDWAASSLARAIVEKLVPPFVISRERRDDDDERDERLDLLVQNACIISFLDVLHGLCLTGMLRQFDDAETEQFRQRHNGDDVFLSADAASDDDDDALLRLPVPLPEVGNDSADTLLSSSAPVPVATKCSLVMRVENLPSNCDQDLMRKLRALIRVAMRQTLVFTCHTYRRFSEADFKLAMRARSDVLGAENMLSTHMRFDPSCDFCAAEADCKQHACSLCHMTFDACPNCLAVTSHDGNEQERSPVCHRHFLSDADRQRRAQCRPRYFWRNSTSRSPAIELSDTLLKQMHSRANIDMLEAREWKDAFASAGAMRRPSDAFLDANDQCMRLVFEVRTRASANATCAYHVAWINPPDHLLALAQKRIRIVENVSAQEFDMARTWINTASSAQDT